MLKNEIAHELLAKYGKQNAPAIKAGDTVRVHQKIKEGDKERVQIFEGLVIAVKHGRSLNGTFTVRKIAAGGVGVERTYPLHSPNVVKVDRVKTADVSRAKLYYMRDRRGKNARFKHEAANSMSWDESQVQPVADPDTTEEIVEEVLETAEVQEEILADVAEGETIDTEAVEAEVAEEVAEEKEEEVAA